MSTTEELKAAYERAEIAFQEARDARREAHIAYKAQIYADTGLDGHLVEFEEHTWRSAKTQKMVVRGLQNLDRLTGQSVKTDGTLGKRSASAPIAQVTDLGPYVEPVKGAK
jgi:hypothetical protein